MNITNNISTGNNETSSSIGIFCYDNDTSLNGITSLTFNHTVTREGFDIEYANDLVSLRFPYLENITEGGYLWVTDCPNLELLDLPKVLTGSLTIRNLGGSTLFDVVKLNPLFSGELKCDMSNLTSLDVTEVTSLSHLDCSYNQLTSLDATGLTSLSRLECFNNLLTSLEIGGATSLSYLDCYNNQLILLNVSGLPLKILRCPNNRIETLNLSEFNGLTELYCGQNRLTTLNISELPSLTQVDCQNNLLTSLNVSGSTSIIQLNAGFNKLTTLNISGLTSLRNLNCYNNNLTTLDISGISSLSSLMCGLNKLTVTAVNDILITLDNNGLSNGYLDLSDGTNASPSGAGITSSNNLTSKGWTVVTN